MKKYLFAAGLFLFAVPAFCCTTFFINRNGQLIFGRNYDWVTANGMICTNQRGLAKTSAPREDGRTISWVSKYGSITFNQYGKEFPTGGMNEKGLVVELMWLDGTKYPAQDERASLGVLQWIQYQLDNCSSVEELIAQDKYLRISAVGTTPLHYLVADGSGNAATIEFLDGKMVVHKGRNLPEPVLTNDRYDYSVDQSNKISQAGNTYSFTSNSIDRFAKTCGRVKDFNETDNAKAINYSFNILDEVAQGSHTKWSIVYDIKNKKIYFRTIGFRDIKELSFSSVDFSCRENSKAWLLNQAGKGDISNSLIDFSIDLNRTVVNQSFDESRSEFTVGEKGRMETSLYPSRLICQ
jgi:choloylglycine hydrolase